MSALNRLLARPRFGPAGVNERMAQMCRGLELGSAIKIVGSNGKGTTAHMMARMAQDLGKSVGLYTSPHLLHVNERIQVNGLPIRDNDLESCLREALTRAKGVPEAGRFEVLTLAGLIHFNRQQVDLAVMEVGLGGRFDPVRIAPGTISVLTSLDLEHTAILGNTLEAIATEKAAVCRPGDTLVSAVGGLEGCLPEGVAFVDLSTPPLSPLQSNARLAAHALKMHFDLATLPPAQPVQVPGRLQKVQHQPPIYVDVAHSPQAVNTAVEALGNRPITLVCAFKADKDLGPIPSLFHHIIALDFDDAMHRSDYILSHLSAGRKSRAESIEQALHLAQTDLPENGVVLCLGGFGLVGRVLAHMQGIHYDVIGL